VRAAVRIVVPVLALFVAAPIASATAQNPLVLQPNWRLLSTDAGVAGFGSYALITNHAGQASDASLIDERTGAQLALTAPSGCFFMTNGGEPTLEGSWVVTQCFQPSSGGSSYELYSIPAGDWTPFTPDSSSCAGTPYCSAGLAAIGDYWAESTVDVCSAAFYPHCATSRYVFQNIATGEVRDRPADWQPGGTEIPDLNSEALTRRLCAPLQVPRGDPDWAYETGFLPGNIVFSGQFAVAHEVYHATTGLADRLVLEQCGTDLRQVLPTSNQYFLTNSDHDLLINTRSVIWPVLGPSETLGGVFLPSRQRFEIPTLPAAPSWLQFVLTERTLYARDGAGHLYAIPAPEPPLLASLSLSPKRFQPANRGPSALQGGRSGTRVTFVLSRAGGVRFTVQRLQQGRIINGRCRRVSRRTGNPECTLFAQKGSFRRIGKTGANSFRFTGRIRDRRLPPGSYRLSAHTTQNVAAPLREAFTITLPKH
jgi:hypothetical protein